jgi:uncharacterized membrane protein
MTRDPSRRNFSASEWKEIDNTARIVALLAGASIAAFGLTRRSATRAAMVGTGLTIASFATRTQDRRKSGEASADATIIVNAPRERVYSFWRDFQNLPRFMNHLKSVKVTDGRHSRWIAYGPFNKEIEWDAEITNEQQNDRIEWRSIEGSDVDMQGSVEFSDATGKRGTLIDVQIAYRGAGSGVAHGVIALMGKDPSFLMRQDMRRFKALLESGEIPTTEGQSHGPRDAMSKFFKAIDPDEPVRKRASRSLNNTSERRVS